MVYFELWLVAHHAWKVRVASLPDGTNAYSANLSAAAGVLLIAGYGSAAYLLNGIWTKIFNAVEMSRVSQDKFLMNNLSSHFPSIVPLAKYRGEDARFHWLQLDRASLLSQSGFATIQEFIRRDALARNVARHNPFGCRKNRDLPVAGVCSAALTQTHSPLISVPCRWSRPQHCARASAPNE
jgi:hypothetical protein